MSSAVSTSSATTTEPEPASLPIGAPPGERGAVTRSGSPVSDALKALDSDQVRREVRALVEQRWPSLQRTVSASYDLTGYRLTSPISEEQREGIRSLSRALTRPADPETVAIELNRCLSLTKSRPQEEGDLTMMIAAFTEELSRYPADLVAWSLRKWSSTSPWWPSLAEILIPIKQELGWRLSLADAANARLNPQEQSRGSAWSTMSQERRDRINAALRRAGVEKVIE